MRQQLSVTLALLLASIVPIAPATADCVPVGEELVCSDDIVPENPCDPATECVPDCIEDGTCEGVDCIPPTNCVPEAPDCAPSGHWVSGEDCPTTDEPEGDVPDCIFNPNPCLNDMLNSPCNLGTHIGDLSEESPVKIYAKRKYPVTAPDIPPTIGVDPSIVPATLAAVQEGTRYEIWAYWELRGETISVGGKWWPIGFGIKYGTVDQYVGSASQKNGVCEKLGEVIGNEFEADVLGGVVGYSGTTGCSWEISVSGTVGGGVSVTIGPNWGVTPTVSGSATLGASLSCGSSTTVDSEVLAQTAGWKPMHIPVWTT